MDPSIKIQKAGVNMEITEVERKTLFVILRVEISETEDLIESADEADAKELREHLEVVKGLFEKAQA